MNTEQTFVINFENETSADAGLKVAQLRDALLDLTPDVRAEIVKDDQSTQDFGATLVLVLGAPAVVIIAKGIVDWLKRYRAKLRITGPNGELLASNISGTDLARIVEAFSKQKYE